MMNCPNCGAIMPAEEWNCVSCRMNVYWATQHYDDLATIRRRQGVPESAPTPPFLVGAHERAMRERAQGGAIADNKVRVIARQAIRRHLQAGDTKTCHTSSDDGTEVESGWQEPT